MSASHKTSTRLTRLDHILEESPPTVETRGGDTDPDQVHLASVPLDRIRALTLELQERATGESDDIDAITTRLLLNDYKTALAHLRAVTNGVDARLHTASREINASRKSVRREQEMAAKRAGRSDDEKQTGAPDEG